MGLFAHPIYSKATNMRFLDCSPHIEELRLHEFLNSSFENKEAEHETRRFRNNPKGFTISRYAGVGTENMPTILTGSKYNLDVESGLKQIGLSFRRCEEFSHANEEDVGSSMILLCFGTESPSSSD
jgi:hypothetical protein